MGVESFSLAPLDYVAIVGYFAALSVVEYLAGRGERASSSEYFLAGKNLPGTWSGDRSSLRISAAITSSE